MNESRFRLGAPEDRPAPQPAFEPAAEPAAEPIASLHLKKTDARMTRLTLFLLLFMVAIAGLVYFDLKKRITDSQMAGLTEVNTLSKELETRFSNLSIKQAGLEQAANQATEGLNKAAESLKKQIQSVDQKWRGASAGNKDALAALQKNSSSIDNNIKSLRTSLEALDKEINGQIKTLRGDLKKRSDKLSKRLDAAADDIASAKELAPRTAAKLNSMQAKVTQMADAQIDQKKLDIMLLNEKVAYQEQLRKMQAKFNRQLAEMANRIASLEQAAKRVRTSPAPPLPAVSAAPSATGKRVIEQTIQQ